jgi:hypothetical protein
MFVLLYLVLTCITASFMIENTRISVKGYEIRDMLLMADGLKKVPEAE